MNDRIYYSREAEQRAQQERVSLALMVMILGVGIGALMALLFAPKPGEETRKSLLETANSAVDDGREATNRVLETLQKDFDRLRKDVEDRMK